MLPPILQTQAPAGPKRPEAAGPAAGPFGPSAGPKLITGGSAAAGAGTEAGPSAGPVAPKSLVKFRHQQGFGAEGGQASSRLSQALMRKKEAREVKPVYHPQCKITATFTRLTTQGSFRVSSRVIWDGCALSPSIPETSGSPLVLATVLSKFGTLRAESSSFRSPVTSPPFVLWLSRIATRIYSPQVKTRWSSVGISRRTRSSGNTTAITLASIRWMFTPLWMSWRREVVMRV